MANPVDLLFSALPASNGNLLFGDTGGEAPPVSATITGSFAPLTVHLLVGPVEEVTITGTFAPLTVEAFAAVEVKVNVTGSFAPMSVAVEAVYASNTARPTVGRTSNPWQVAVPTDTGFETGQQDTPALPATLDSRWGRAAEGTVGIEARQPSVFASGQVERRARFQDGADLRHEIEFVYEEANRKVRQTLATAFENAVRVHDETLFRHQDGNRTVRASRSTPFQQALANQGLMHNGSFQAALALLLGRSTRYQEAVPPPPGLSVMPVDPPVFGCYDPNPDIVFSFPFDTAPNLLFQCGLYVEPEEPPQGEVIVPVQKVYIVANNVSLRRASDNSPVHALSMTLALDVDSWSWGFSAQVPGVAQALVEPTSSGPVELIASVNGTEFRVLAENVSRERTFGRTTLRVTGRGRNARLDAPYAAVQSFANSDSRTAQQLMNDVLTLNGIPLGWNIVWELEDWSVPAGVFSHQGTHITALSEIAKSAGGYLVPHPSLQRFTVKHLYPTAPWQWGSVTPNFTLPADVVTRESFQWAEKPGYNRVFVSGQGQGVLGQITRAGTAGEVLAQMVVDPLITDTIAARQRGRAILSDTGRQIRVGLRLPVLQSTGIIQPGAFVNYQDGGASRLGLVRGVNVEVGDPAVWQTLEVETHV